MMKRPHPLLVTGALALCLLARLPAHADDNDNRALLNRIVELEGEMKTLAQRQNAPPPGAASDINGTNINSAVNTPDLETRLSALETQIRNLTGQVEQSTYQNQQTNTAMQKLGSDMDFRMQQLEQRQQAAAPGSTAPAPVPPGNPVTMAADPNAPPPAAVPPASTVISNTTAAVNQDAPATPEELYNKAYSEMQRKEYPAAQQDFKSFLATNQGSKLVPNAQYWLGEIYYAQGNYKLASATFADGYQKNPKGAKAPDNLLKLGLSLEQQNRSKDACTVLHQLLKDFPEAPDTIRTSATHGLKRLQCS